MLRGLPLKLGYGAWAQKLYVPNKVGHIYCYNNFAGVGQLS